MAAPDVTATPYSSTMIPTLAHASCPSLLLLLLLPSAAAAVLYQHIATVLAAIHCQFQSFPIHPSTADHGIESISLMMPR
jgi:hypothetical protein